MCKVSLAGVVVMALSVACSDDTKTGRFVDSAVQGLHYASSSGSGLTDADGRFTYKSGESVTFSVGGITLGSAKGASELTPFDLVGSKPPTTEVDARRVMLDRQGVDAFDRAANVIYFLVALDRDQNPANGIDLTGWHETLTNAALSFEVDAATFVYQRFEVFTRRYDGIALPEGHLPLAHFYASAGIQIPAHVAVTYVEDQDDDGTYESQNVYAHDELGRFVEARYNDNGDAFDDQRTTTTYGSNGRVATYVFAYDYDANGSFEATGGYTYSYDERGNLTREVFEQATDGVPTSRSTTTSVFTARNDVASQVIESDAGADGTVNSRVTRTLTHAENGDRIGRRVETDSDANGTPNSIVVDTYTFDVDGRVINQVTTNDSNGDGTTDTSQVRTLVYDDSGNQLSESTERFNSTGTLTRREVYTFAFDAGGMRTLTQRASDDDGDGTDDSTSTTTYEHDDAGNYTLYRASYDTDGDGVTDSISTQSYTFNAFHQTLTSLSEVDASGDGTVDRRNLATYVYDDLGYYQSGLTQYDDDGDGVYETKVRSTSTYADIADGIHAILLDTIVD